MTPDQLQALAPSIAATLGPYQPQINVSKAHSVRTVRIACCPQNAVAWRFVIEHPDLFPVQHQALLAAIIKALAEAANKPLIEKVGPSVARLITPASDSSLREIAPLLVVQVNPSQSPDGAELDGLFLLVSLKFNPSVFKNHGPFCSIPDHLKPGGENGDALPPFAPVPLSPFSSNSASRSIERFGGDSDDPQKAKATVVWTIKDGNSGSDIHLFKNLELVILIIQHFSMTPSQIAHTMFPHLVGSEKYRPGSVTIKQKSILNRATGLVTGISTTIMVEVRETSSTTAIINESLKAFHRMVDELPSVQNHTRKRKVDEMVQDADLKTVESGDDVYIHYPPVKKQSSSSSED